MVIGGFAHTAEQAKEMGFWAFHVDTLGWSVLLGVVFLFIFRLAAKEGHQRPAGWTAELRRGDGRVRRHQRQGHLPRA